MSFYLSFEESSDDGPGAKISGGSWDNDFDRNDIKASLASIRMSEDTPMEEKSEGKDGDTREAARVVWCSSDATLQIIGAVDWTGRVCLRREIEGDAAKLAARPSLEGEPNAHIISVVELMAFICLVVVRASEWHGRLVIIAVDNDNVRIWINSKGRGTWQRAFSSKS